MCTCGLVHPTFSPPGGLTRRRVLRLVCAAALAPTLTGCERIAPYLVSEETVEQLGKQSWARMQQQMPISRDAGARRRVVGIAERLLAAAGENPGRWEVQ